MSYKDYKGSPCWTSPKLKVPRLFARSEKVFDFSRLSGFSRLFDFFPIFWDFSKLFRDFGLQGLLGISSGVQPRFRELKELWLDFNVHDWFYACKPWQCQVSSKKGYTKSAKQIRRGDLVTKTSGARLSRYMCSAHIQFVLLVGTST